MSPSGNESSGSTEQFRPAVGDRLEVEVEAVAHGGHMVARPSGFVTFVRYALPGERVIAQVTEVRKAHAFAEAVEVLRAHADRRPATCPAFHPLGCGGCDFQHAERELQLEMKSQVLHEALIRHGRLQEAQVDSLMGQGVRPLGPEYGWRSRMRFGVLRDGEGRSQPALHAHHSADRIAAHQCTIAAPEVLRKAIECAESATEQDVIVVAEGDDAVQARVRADGEDPLDGPDAPRVRHRLVLDDHTVDFRIPLEGFWQADPRLLPELIDAVLAFGEVKPGQHWWDLYAGAGPLAAALGDRTGASGGVQAVEGSASAVRSARRALHGMPWVRLHQADVRDWLTERARSTGDVRGKSVESQLAGIVLDPPRNGAGVAVIDAIAETAVPLLVYVACDPVALGRDTAYLEQRGYRLTRLRAWDAFPQSHHFETVAAFEAVDQIS